MYSHKIARSFSGTAGLNTKDNITERNLSTGNFNVINPTTPVLYMNSVPYNFEGEISAQWLNDHCTNWRRLLRFNEAVK